jgi:hypothetical protein
MLVANLSHVPLPPARDAAASLRESEWNALGEI